MTGGLGDSSARPVFEYKLGGHRGGASDEIPEPHLTHFRLLVPKKTAAANSLCGLLPNIGGAGVGVCQLYVRVVRSRVLYDVPVWVENLMASRRSLLLLRRLYRTTVIRIIRGYRTVPYASASPPFQLQTLML